MLSGFGAFAGLWVAVPVMRFLETLLPETMAVIGLTLDWRVLAFSAAIAVAAGLTFGLVPALGGSRLALQQGLREGGRGTSGARSHWFQHSLIVIQTALAVVLLTTGGLLLQTFQHLRGRSWNPQRRPADLRDTAVPYPTFDQRVAFVNAHWRRFARFPASSTRSRFREFS